MVHDSVEHKLVAVPVDANKGAMKRDLTCRQRGESEEEWITRTLEEQRLITLDYLAEMEQKLGLHDTPEQIRYRKAGVNQERERVIRVLDYHLQRLKSSSQTRLQLLDSIWEDVEKGQDFLFENPTVVEEKGGLASGVSQKGQQYYRMYEERFGKKETDTPDSDPA